MIENALRKSNENSIKTFLGIVGTKLVRSIASFKVVLATAYVAGNMELNYEHPQLPQCIANEWCGREHNAAHTTHSLLLLLLASAAANMLQLRNLNY
jgi:hypothetical protein